MALAARKRDEAEERYFDLGRSMKVWLGVQLSLLLALVLVWVFVGGLFGEVFSLSCGVVSLAIAYWVKLLGEERREAIALARAMNVRVNDYGEDAYGGSLPPGAEQGEWQGFFEEALREQRGEEGGPEHSS